MGKATEVQERLNRWIVAVNRKEWQPKEGTRICSVHFISGLIVLTAVLVLGSSLKSKTSSPD